MRNVILGGRFAAAGVLVAGGSVLCLESGLQSVVRDSAGTVFDPEGRALGFPETPPGLRILEIGPDYVLGGAHDALGIEYAQLWPLDRSDP